MLLDAPVIRPRRLLHALTCSFLLGIFSFLLVGTAKAFERTEEREACANHDAQRRPFFGDLHVHSRYSFDSYISSQRNDPWETYRFAKGEAITLPDADGEQTVRFQLARRSQAQTLRGNER